MKKALLAGILGLLVLTASAVMGQERGDAFYTYSVKFVCGKEGGKILAPGVYTTAINVHNPSEGPAYYEKKFSVALPGEEAGPVTDFFKGKLGPGEAMEIDCGDIMKHLKWDRPFVKGFVFIQSNVRLNVVAVYTADDMDGSVQSIDVEQYQPFGRSSAGCPDLVVTEIMRPEWDGENRRSIIRATIKNIGDAAADKSIARVIDPSTPQPTGAPYNAIADTPALNPGQTATVTFYLPYWVYNPDATLDVTADYKGMVKECREDNNSQRFEEIG